MVSNHPAFMRSYLLLLNRGVRHLCVSLIRNLLAQLFSHPLFGRLRIVSNVVCLLIPYYQLSESKIIKFGAFFALYALASYVCVCVCHSLAYSWRRVENEKK